MSNEIAPVLLVEDNEDDIFAFKRAFKKAEITHPLHVVTDGQKALDYLASLGAAPSLPCVTFLDLKLPFYTGFEILTWLRGQPTVSDLQVIVLTGSDEVRDHEQADSLGVYRYLVKPATPEDIKVAVGSLCGPS